MIGRLRGMVFSVAEDRTILDVNGVGYEVFISTRSAAALASGNEAVLIIETHVREDHIHLFGFLSADEKEWFNTLTTVKGVGAKMALNILGAFDESQLYTVIASKDVTAFKPVSGVGPKLAERIVTELKSKVEKLPMGGHGTAPALASVSASKSGAKAPSSFDDALQALAQLGYGRAEAYQAVQESLAEAPEASVEALIKDGLKRLAS